MLQLDEIVNLIAVNFFGGSIEIAGAVVFSIALMLLFAFTKNVFQTLLIALPVTFIFNLLGLLPSDMTILLLIVVVLGLAMSAKDTFRR